MPLLDHLRPRSITAQITGIVAISVIAGIVLVMAVVLYFDDANPRYRLASLEARIGIAVQLVRAAGSEDEIAAALAIAQDTGIKVRQVAMADLQLVPQGCCRLADLSVLAHRLKAHWGIDLLEVVPPAGSASEQAAVSLDGRNALLFDEPFGFSRWLIVLAPSALTLVTVLLFVVLLSFYALCWIIAPLSAVAAAAQSFGRSPHDDRLVPCSGPQEIAQVADALNDMRTRIRALLDDRTRMLAAISHDLRTPLTRLRLRAERLTDRDAADGLLHEITRITHMLDETLNYLRRDGRSESPSRVDLPSLLQTVCVEFADVGHAVTYDGPAHATWTCRPNILARALSNVVDNAVKHGSTVTVALRVDERGAVIDVSDDGPGIPSALRDKVFDAFFKGDTARGAVNRSGFGLGLSIARDVVKSHGGEIDLLDRAPHGLVVRMLLPAETSLNIT
jgi:signal transduction histidine kinase